MSDTPGSRLEAPPAFLSHLGARMTGWSDGWAKVEMPLEPHALNRQGLPHGGVHATLMDSAMGYAGCWSDDPEVQKLALTLSMTVNFIAQAGPGPLVAEGWVTGGGRRTYFAEGRVCDGAGAVLSTATGVFRRRTG